MEGVLVDRALMNPRRSGAGAVNGGFLSISFGSSSSSSSLSQLLIGAGGGGANVAGGRGGVGVFGSRPPPPRHHSSLPILYPSTRSLPPPPHPLQMAPLLPLPFSKSASVPPPAKAAAGAGARSRDQYKKAKSPVSSSRKPAKIARGEIAIIAPQKPVEKAEKNELEIEVAEEEGEEGGLVFNGSLYSISPPPSSLPLPATFLIRPRSAAGASCVAEAMGGRGGIAFDSGATDDLRRLLRL